MAIVAMAAMAVMAEEAPPRRKGHRHRRQQNVFAAAPPPSFHTPSPPTRPRPSAAAAGPSAAEIRNQRIRQEGRRRRVLQLEYMKRVVDSHALRVATGEKTKKQQQVYDLTAKSSVPSAASASQRWRGVIRRVIDQRHEAPPQDNDNDNDNDDNDDDEDNDDEGDDGSKDHNTPHEVVLSTAATAGLPAAQHEQHQRQQAAAVGVGGSAAHNSNNDHKSSDGVAGMGGAFFGATTIAAIAMKARCRDALKVLHYLRKLREERENGTASSRSNWLDDNSRCSAIFGLLASIPAIDSLDFFFRRTLLPKLELVNLRKGEAVFHQDDEEMTVWLILDGRVGISSKDAYGTVHHAGELDEGQVIGNLLPEKRLATATCLEPCILLRINNADILEALEDPEAKLAVSKKTFFRTIPLFKGLGERDLDRLTSIFHVVTLHDGDILCREGHRVDHLYLVQRGHFRLLKAFVPRSETAKDSDASPRRPDCSKVGVTPPTQRQRHGSSVSSAVATGHGGVVLEVEADTSIGREEGVEEKRWPEEEDEEARTEAAAAAAEAEAAAAAAAAAAAVAAAAAATAAAAAAKAATLPSLSHFDVGVLGRKDFVGEAGFMAAAFAGAGTSGAKGGGVGRSGGDRGRGGGHSSAFGAWNGRSGATGGSGIGVGGAGAEVGATHEYIVSAIAEGGAEVLAAKVVDLMFMQTVTMKRCWAEGREHHQSRERKWKPATLGAEMRKQVLWERTKRAIVLDHVRTEVLERKLAATGVRGGPGAVGMAGTAVGAAPAVIS